MYLHQAPRQPSCHKQQGSTQKVNATEMPLTRFMSFSSINYFPKIIHPISISTHLKSRVLARQKNPSVNPTQQARPPDPPQSTMLFIHLIYQSYLQDTAVYKASDKQGYQNILNN